jgi:hypothetical protein
MSRFFRLAVVAAFLATLIAHGQVLNTTEAKDHLGQTATVCGTIASEAAATGSRGAPTFINLDQPYPHQVFTVLIWGADQAAVGKIPEAGRVCAKGPIALYHGVPQIVVHKSSDFYAPTLSNDKHYTNSDGQSVHSPAYSNGSPPVGATAFCNDGTYSFSQHRQGTCSHHGGVKKWL